MKAPDHQVRGMLFICVCLLAGLILYMFLSRAPQDTTVSSEVAIANDQGVDAASDRREVDDASKDAGDTTANPDESQATDDDYDTATDPPSRNANQGSAGNRATVRTPCSGEWSAAPDGPPSLSIKPSSDSSGTFYTYVNDELGDFGPYFGTPNFVMFDIDDKRQSYRMVCNSESAELEINQGESSETIKVYRVPEHILQ